MMTTARLLKNGSQMRGVTPSTVVRMPRLTGRSLLRGYLFFPHSGLALDELLPFRLQRCLGDSQFRAIALDPRLRDRVAQKERTRPFQVGPAGYAIGRRIDARLTLAALATAIEGRNPPPGRIHHSDRGSHYAAQAYRALLSEHGPVGSMARRGNPTTR